MRRRSLILVPLAVPALAQAPLALTLGTATPGGGFPAYGAGFVAALAAVDPGLLITPQNTEGSTQNVRLLAEGRLDLALVQGETATRALTGGSGTTLITAMYATPGLFALRGDHQARSITELRGQPIAWGARGSGFIVLARQMTGALRLDMERDFQAVFLDRAGDGPAMVLDGRVAALWGGGAGWPGFATIANGPRGARFVAPDAAERARILAAEPLLGAMRLPARSYAGQEEAIESVGSWALVLARPGLPEEAAERLARALLAARAELASRLPQGNETTPENTLAAAPRPETLHPAVRRVLRGAGYAA